MKITGVKPINDFVLIEPEQVEEKTASGLYIPDAAKEKPQRGTVVAVGDGTEKEPMILKEEFTVLFKKYAGTDVELNGKNYLLMKQSDVYAILQITK